MTGYVAFLDVLGFSQAVLQNNDLAKLEQYRQLVANTMAPFGDLEYVVFSDNILITSQNDSVEAFERTVSCVGSFLHRFSLSRTPLRGCISHGQFERFSKGRHGVVVAGRPIIDAYRYEQSQDWVGAMISPLVFQAHPELAGRMRRLPFAARCHAAAVPFHDGEYLTGFAVLPLLPEMEEQRAVLDNLRAVSKRLSELLIMSPEPASQAKYDRTVKWLKEVRTSLTRMYTKKT